MDGIGVTVDTVKGNFVELKIEETGGELEVNLAETEGGEVIDPNTNAVGTDKEGSATADLTITLPKITLTYGSDWEGASAPKLSFSLESSKNAANQVSTALVDGIRESEGPWTYLDAPEAVSITSTENMTSETDGSTTVWTITNLSLKFQWGTFFGSTSPAAFYNSKFYKADSTGSSALDGKPTDGRTALTIDYATKITNEINNMKAAFEAEDPGSQLVLTVTAIKG